MDNPTDELQVLAPRVLAISYNPIVEPARGLSLVQQRGWNRVEDLIQGYVSDISECSAGLVRCRVVAHEEVDAFPLKADGFRYTAHSYLDVMDGRKKGHSPDAVDYGQIVSDFNLLERVASSEIDEVWLFGFPYAGFYESRMAGAGAFWCNAPPLENTQSCPRRFVIMGFSYERGVGEMLEDLGHRAESILEHVYAGRPDDANPWKRFTRYDQVAPGHAEVGTVHFAPNSQRDYDWGNRRVVTSGCDDWLHYPNLSGRRRRVNCTEWGSGDIRRHHKWWLAHLPNAPGITEGVANNWWRYVIGVDDPYFD